MKLNTGIKYSGLYVILRKVIFTFFGALFGVAYAKSGSTTYYSEEPFTFAIRNGKASVSADSKTISNYTHVQIPSIVNELYPVTAINSFSGCKTLISVDIPDSVEKISGGAFKNCYNLHELSIPYSVTELSNEAFYNCTNLINVTIPSSISSISMWTFYGCKRLQEAPLHDNITFIGNNAFQGCSGLVSVILPSKLEVMQSNAFCDCDNLMHLSVANAVSKIGTGAFYNCKNLSDVILQDGLTIIGAKMFMNCYKLETIKIPGSVSSIGDGAFLYCTNLMNVVIDEGVSRIGLQMFACCKGLTNVTLPSTVNLIDDEAFWFCSSLSSIRLPPSLRSINDYAFYRCSSLEFINLPQSITNIGQHAFQYCDSLKDIVLPETIDVIKHGLFDGCSGLESIHIPASVKEIQAYAFQNCSKLQVVNGLTVTNVRGRAFYGCSSIRRLTFSSDLVFIGDDAFNNCPYLEEISFEGAPPDTNSDIITNTNSIVFGTYTKDHQAEWESVIDCNGYWKGLKMRPAWHTITYDANGGEGTMPAQNIAIGENASIVQNSLRWEQHYFMGWALEANGEVIYNDGDEISIDKDITLYAKWEEYPKVTVSAKSYDSQAGSLKIQWGLQNDKLPEDMTYEVRRGFSDSFEVAEILTNGYDQLTYTDSQFDSTGGTSRIWYWVKPEHEWFEPSEPCVTKNRYAIAAGISEMYADNDASLFADLAKVKLNVVNDPLIQEPTAGKIRNSIAEITRKIIPGDIVLMYIASHGHDDGSDSYLSLKTGNHYKATDLNADANAVASRQSRFVGIIMACHSEAQILDGRLVEESSRLEQFCNAACGEGNNPLIAWIASARKNQFSYSSKTGLTRFGYSFLLDGWSNGYADIDLYINGEKENVESHNDGKINMLELAHYTAKMAVGGFTDDSFWSTIKRGSSVDGNSSVYIQNPQILERVELGESKGPYVSGNLLPPDSVTIKTIMLESPIISWNDVDGATEYRVYRYLLDKNKLQAVHLNVRGTSVPDSLSRGIIFRDNYNYVVQAVNAAGISAPRYSDNEPSQTEIDIRQVDFQDTLLSYGIDTGNLSIDDLDNIAIDDLDGDGISVANEYIAGVSPLDATKQFHANINISDEGLPEITYEPDMRETRKYTIYGKKTLSSTTTSKAGGLLTSNADVNNDWVDMDTIPEVDKKDYKFFKVHVSLP